LKLDSGKCWEKDFEVTIGANVAASQKLRPGDQIFGAHGLTSVQDEHKENAYIVSGVLAPQGNVTDNLVLTNIASIWKMHGQKNEHEETNAGVADTKTQAAASPAKEITSLLIQYQSPMSIVMFPQMVNKTTNMQAASPALESGRLFSLIGVGIDTLQWFAILIMFIAAVSVFVSLYNSLKERKYDLAMMRIMGASQGKLFLVIILEGIILTLIGSVLGIFLGHFAIEFIGSSQPSTQAKMSGLFFVREESYLFAAGITIGFVAALIPAIQAYRSNIAAIIAKT
jgi:putative ABC transport system permease protein